MSLESRPEVSGELYSMTEDYSISQLSDTIATCTGNVASSAKKLDF